MSREKQNTPTNTPTNTNLHQPCKSVQVEEMARDICRSRVGENAILCKECDKECLYYQIATALIAKDYRKQSEGEWIFEHEFYGKMLCSNCKQEALVNENNEYVDSDFCPNCGAKMKGGAE